MNKSSSCEDAPEPGFLQSHTGFSTVGYPSLVGNWKERNLLSLDGGGIRGYWTLLVLGRLMEAIGREERNQSPGQVRYDSFHPEPFPEHVTHCERRREDEESSPRLDAQRFLPCHYFDLICGSSTGSLIAIMLCRFRMTVKDCLLEYKSMAQKIFGKPRFISQLNIGIVRWPKYNAAGVRKAFEEVTRRRGEKPAANQPGDAMPLFPTIPGTCSMFVPTNLRLQNKETNEKRLCLIRSYDHDNPRSGGRSAPITNFGKADNMWIWQVARAATAAPMYFTELEYTTGSDDPTTKYFYSDGGYGPNNNPTSLGIKELEAMHGKTGVGAIVSIGTARADTDPGKKSIIYRIKEGFHTATDPNPVADMVSAEGRPHYWRLNGKTGIDIELDDWKPNDFLTPLHLRGRKTLEKILRHFHKWASDNENQRMIEKCAQELVARRIMRSRDGDKWYRFANGASHFECRHEDCPTRYRTREEFCDHWRRIHQPHEDAYRYQDPDFSMWVYPPKERLR